MGVIQYIRWLSVADRHTKMYLDRHLAKLGLNSSQYMYILRVCQAPGMTQDQFLASFNIHPSNITRALGALEKEGFLRRESNETDKRTWRVYPTERAEQVYPQIRRICEQWQYALIEGMPDAEAAQFQRLLEQVARRAVALCREEEE